MKVVSGIRIEMKINGEIHNAGRVTRLSCIREGRDCKD